MGHYSQPKLLFLDEATSHLDIHNEQWVNAAVKQLDITRVIVAHRPETIASTDRVLVLHGGQIVQSIDNRAQDCIGECFDMGVAHNSACRGLHPCRS